MIKAIRTPENRFENLEGYEFSSHYLEVEEGVRLHYLDEGNKDKPVVLLLHGEPSWSYLYRKMIPILSTDFRVIAPDLIGFGKSDKLVDRADYTYQKHIDWLTSLVHQLDLKNIILFCQDWGGLIGLRMVTEMEERFSMVIASNTFLPTGEFPIPDSFKKWLEFSQHSPKFNIGTVIQSGTSIPLSADIIAAYDAPFPSEEYKEGARIFPTLVPISTDNPEANNNKNAWMKLSQWKKPFLTIFGSKDDITKGAEKIFKQIVPGAKGQNHKILDAGHFIQEEKGEELAHLIIDFYNSNINIV